MYTISVTGAVIFLNVLALACVCLGVTVFGLTVYARLVFHAVNTLLFVSHVFITFWVIHTFLDFSDASF